MDDHAITDSYERETLEQTIAVMQRLHAAGRDHIWAYYTRNLVRPVVLSREKVERYHRQPAVAELQPNREYTAHRVGREFSKDRYGIWAGGRYATLLTRT